MKALTLWQPWSWAIAHAGKRIENRTWAPPSSMFDKRIAIHAGKTLDKDSVLHLQDEVEGLPVVPPTFVHGAIEAVATVLGAVHYSGRAVRLQLGPDGISRVRNNIWFNGPWGWVLGDVVTLPEPVPCRGAQGLWTLTDDVERAVLEQMARAA